jgi:Dyp-type peroxidase family
MDHNRGAAAMSVDLTDKEIDHKAEKYQTMLTNLQGNILKGHGRDHSVHLFLKFTATPRMVRDWVRAFTDRYVTSARQQLKEVEEFNKYRIPGGLFGNFFLSAKGYEALDLTNKEIASCFKEEHAVINGEEVVTIKFRDGMESYQRELDDPDPATWEEAYRGRQLDAMILLADDDEGFLLRQARAVFEDVKTVADVLAVEHGRVLRNDADESIEHFGYVDGRSQPLFLQMDIASEKKEVGVDQWNPSAPLELVLVPDPHVEKEKDCFGSYLVFRKLEQNVWGFKKREKELAHDLGLKEEEEERAGALIVGRFEDGTPVTLSATEETEEMVKPVPNNFDYRHDRNATRCPFHAHIRKVNPRGDTGSLEEERKHRVVRRGITYGKRLVEPKDDPTLDQMPRDGVGLLFMCFQSNLADQFGFLQKIYANSPDFVKTGTGFDPVIGQKDLNACPMEQHWPREWGKARVKDVHFGDFVKLKGGEFFFAPSIHFFKTL